jgi:hypothetical protein
MSVYERMVKSTLEINFGTCIWLTMVHTIVEKCPLCET